MRFAGKLALVAGGTGALGRAVAQAFLREGSDVVVSYQNEQEFLELRRLAGAETSKLAGHELDVTAEAAVEDLVQRITSDHGHLDILVNTVGGYVGGVKLWDLNSKVFERMLTLNLRSGFLLSRAVVKRMLKQGKGAIHQCGSESRVRPRSRSGRVRSIQGCGGGDDGLPCRRSQGNWSACEFSSAEYHRYASEPERDARRRFFTVAETGGYRTCHPVSV